MARRVVPLTPDILSGLPTPCDTCVFWELGPAGSRRPPADPAAVKRSWLEATTRGWGTGGLAIEVDGETAGYALYAPPDAVPRAAAFPTSPPTAGAALLLVARVRPDLTGQGLGRMLVQAVARDVQQRDVRMLEAFGAASGSARCVLPVDFLIRVGFAPVREHPRWPRLRMDLRTTLPLLAEVEEAWGRLVGAVRRPDAAVRPV